MMRSKPSFAFEVQWSHAISGSTDPLCRTQLYNSCRTCWFRLFSSRFRLGNSQTSVHSFCLGLQFHARRSAPWPASGCGMHSAIPPRLLRRQNKQIFCCSTTHEDQFFAYSFLSVFTSYILGLPNRELQLLVSTGHRVHAHFLCNLNQGGRILQSPLHQQEIFMRPAVDYSAVQLPNLL